MKTTNLHYDKLKNDYKNHIGLSKNIGKYFGGPSLYFHSRALSEIKNGFLKDNHIEMIYATLASWGMHRMGITKTKLVNFKEFKTSILRNRIELENLKDLRLEEFQQNEINEIVSRLNKVCFDLQVSASNSKIVGNSKTLAHILPNLVPPIDRQYTIQFFKCNELNKTIGNFKNIKEESEYFNFIMFKAYDFITHIKNDKLIEIDNNFNTSYPKIFDNLIVTYIRNVK